LPDKSNLNYYFYFYFFSSFPFCEVGVTGNHPQEGGGILSQNLATDCGMSQIWLPRGVMHRKEEIFFGFLLFLCWRARSRNVLSKYGDSRHFFFSFFFSLHLWRASLAYLFPKDLGNRFFIFSKFRGKKIKNKIL
jgi:hypothetical protein